MTRGIPCNAILFDKDGTLFDFNRSWANWTADVLLHLARGDRDEATRVARLIGFDLAERRFSPWCPVIHGSPGDVTEALASELDGWTFDEIDAYLVFSSMSAEMVEFVPLAPLLDRLLAMGLVLGVATNDYAALAMRQLQDHGVDGHFQFIAGYDSGFGCKPDPGMLMAFCQRTGIHPTETVMIGDSNVDMIAARRAGMRAIGVKNGVGDAEELSASADYMIDSIAELPGMLETGKPTA